MDRINRAVNLRTLADRDAYRADVLTTLAQFCGEALRAYRAGDLDSVDVPQAVQICENLRCVFEDRDPLFGRIAMMHHAAAVLSTVQFNTRIGGAPECFADRSRALVAVLRLVLFAPDQEIERAMRATLVCHPADPALWFHRGVLRHRQGRFAVAEAALRRSVVLNPDGRMSRLRWAYCLTHLQRFDDSLAAFAATFNVKMTRQAAARELDASRARYWSRDLPPLPSTPKVSVVITSHSRVNLLSVAIGKLRQQTYENLELILVEEDTSEEMDEYIAELVASEPRLRLVRVPQADFVSSDPVYHMVAKCNRGWEISSGDLFMHHSDDDFLDPDYIEKMVALFKENPLCLSATGGVRKINAHGIPIHSYDLDMVKPRYMPGLITLFDECHPVAPHVDGFYQAYAVSLTYRRTVMDRCGGYKIPHNDVWRLCAMPRGDLGYDPSTKINWRLHPEQTSKRQLNPGDHRWSSKHLPRHLLEVDLEEDLRELDGLLGKKMMWWYNRRRGLQNLKIFIRKYLSGDESAPSFIESIRKSSPGIENTEEFRKAERMILAAN